MKNMDNISPTLPITKKYTEKIASKRYKISFITYLLAKVHYINLLIDYHFLFLGFVSSFVRY